MQGTVGARKELKNGVRKAPDDQERYECLDTNGNIMTFFSQDPIVVSQKIPQFVLERKEQIRLRDENLLADRFWSDAISSVDEDHALSAALNSQLGRSLSLAHSCSQHLGQKGLKVSDGQLLRLKDHVSSIRANYGLQSSLFDRMFSCKRFSSASVDAVADRLMQTSEREQMLADAKNETSCRLVDKSGNLTNRRKRRPHKLCVTNSVFMPWDNLVSGDSATISLLGELSNRYWSSKKTSCSESAAISGSDVESTLSGCSSSATFKQQRSVVKTGNKRINVPNRKSPSEVLAAFGLTLDTFDHISPRLLSACKKPRVLSARKQNAVAPFRVTPERNGTGKQEVPVALIVPNIGQNPFVYYSSHSSKSKISSCDRTFMAQEASLETYLDNKADVLWPYLTESRDNFSISED